MRLVRISATSTVATLGVVAAVVFGAGAAAAAPSGTSVSDTIGQLRAEGNNVVIDRVGTGPMEQCSVTSVRSVERKASSANNPFVNFPIVGPPNTVHVGLTC